MNTSLDRRRRVRVWDLPIRIFHWALAVAFAAAFLTAWARTRLDVHVLAGTAVGLLLLFRAWWARRGTRWARAEGLVQPRAVVWAQVRGLLRGLRPGSEAPTEAPVVHPGHTPLAGWAALLGMGLLVVSTLTGLVVLGGEEQVGVLAWIPVDVGIAVHPIHGVAAWASLAWVGVHLLGVLKESVRSGVNLPRAMVDGRKPVAVPPVAAKGGVALGLVVSLGVLLVSPPQAATRAPVAPEDPRWEAECGSCHLAYDPGLLPARSWARLLAEQDRHFGEDLFLDPATAAALAEWAGSHAAEGARTEAAARSRASAGDAPLRITELPWWAEVHAGTADTDRASTSNGGRCGACHPDAATGRFDPLLVHPVQGG